MGGRSRVVRGAAAAIVLLPLAACGGGGPAGGGTASPSVRASSSAPSSSAPAPSTPAPPEPPGPVKVGPFFDALERQIRAADTAYVATESDYAAVYAEISESTSSIRLHLEDADRQMRVVIIGKRTWTLDESGGGTTWRAAKKVPDGVEAALPANQVSQWRDGARSVTRGASEVVEGHTLTSYSLVVAADEAWGAIGVARQPGSPRTITYRLRLDEKGLPRDATASLGDAKVRIDYAKWGEPVEVVPPSVG